VRRTAHPTDRRAKVVEATRKGKELARRADEIIATPPAALSALAAEELETLARILARARNPE
jgi:DNA-binding MarR family transcriptional regulator